MSDSKNPSVSQTFDRLDREQTEYWLELARKWKAWVPSQPKSGDDENWKRLENDEFVLTHKGQQGISQSVDDRKKAKREAILGWTSIAVVPLSLAVAIFALVAGKTPPPPVYVTVPPNSIRVTVQPPPSAALVAPMTNPQVEDKRNR